MPINDKKNLKKNKERVRSPQEKSKTQRNLKSNNKEIKQSEKIRLQTLRMKQQAEFEILANERSNFRKLSRNPGSNKTRTSKKKKASVEPIIARSKSKRESKKVRKEMENLKKRRSKSNKQELSKLKDKLNRFTDKIKKEELEEGSHEDSNEESERSNVERENNDRSSFEECFYDEYLDTPDKQLKQNFSPNEKLKIPLLAAQYELEKPLRRLKSKIREKYEQKNHKRTPSKYNPSKSKGRENRRKMRRRTKEKKDHVEKEKRLAQTKRVGLYTQKFYHASDIYFELDGVEIESGIADYHKYANEFKPSDLFIDLVLEREENTRTQSMYTNERVDELKEEERGQPSRARKGHYTLDEDLKIIEYIKAHSDYILQPISKKYWEKAIEKYNLLEGTRSAGSLRDRYRLYLGDLDENDKEVIDAWLSKNGRTGYLIFKEKDAEDITGQKYRRNGLETIALKYHPSTQNRPARKEHKLTKLSDSKTRTKLEMQFENSDDGSDEEEIVQKPVELVAELPKDSYSKSPLPASRDMEVEDSAKNKPRLKFSNHREYQLRITSPYRLVRHRQKTAKDTIIDQNHDDDEIESVEDKIVPEKSLSDDISTQKTSQRFSQPAQSSIIRSELIRSIDTRLEDDIEEEKRAVDEIVYSFKEKISAYQKPEQTSESKNVLPRYSTPLRERNFEEQDIVGSKPRKQIKKPENPNSSTENTDNFNQILKESHSAQREINQQDMQKVIEKADWVKKISKTYNKSPKELLDIFYYCSMNAKILEKYFAGEDYLLWTKEEDDILLEGRDRVIRVLKKYKKPENVLIRQEFFKNYHHLKQSNNNENLLVQ